jgi:hypothetical protein
MGGVMDGGGIGVVSLCRDREVVENDRVIEEVEDGVDDVVDVALDSVCGPGPKAPSRVNIWTCIRHLINSIGVLQRQLVQLHPVSLGRDLILSLLK